MLCLEMCPREALSCASMCVCVCFRRPLAGCVCACMSTTWGVRLEARESACC